MNKATTIPFGHPPKPQARHRGPAQFRAGRRHRHGGAADIILCSDCARFGVPEIDRGAMGGGAHLQRMFPVQKVRYMYFTGEFIDAAGRPIAWGRWAGGAAGAVVAHRPRDRRRRSPPNRRPWWKLARRPSPALRTATWKTSTAGSRVSPWRPIPWAIPGIARCLCRQARREI